MRLHSTQTQFNTNPWNISSFYHSLQYIFFISRLWVFFFFTQFFFWLVSFYLFRYVSLLQALSKILLGIKIGFNLLLTLFNFNSYKTFTLPKGLEFWLYESLLKFSAMRLPWFCNHHSLLEQSMWLKFAIQKTIFLPRLCKLCSHKH